MRQVLGPAGEIELISPGAYLVEDIPDPGPAIYHRFTDPEDFLDCMWDVEECDAWPGGFIRAYMEEFAGRSSRRKAMRSAVEAGLVRWWSKPAFRPFCMSLPRP